MCQPKEGKTAARLSQLPRQSTNVSTVKLRKLKYYAVNFSSFTLNVTQSFVKGQTHSEFSFRGNCDWSASRGVTLLQHFRGRVRLG